MSAIGDYEVTEADLRAARRGYYASISYIDDLVGQLIEGLKATGALDNTVIVFTSDHGDFLGERGLWYKMSFLEPSAHIPFIVWSPNRFTPRRVREPVSLCDILPTFVELASGKPAMLARPVDGRSLVPLLNGAAENESATVWGEYLAEGAIAPLYMLRRGTLEISSTRPAIPISSSIWPAIRTKRGISPRISRRSADASAPRSGSSVRYSAHPCRGAEEPAGAAHDVRGAEARQSFSLGFPAVARRLATNIRATICRSPSVTIRAVCPGHLISRAKSGPRPSASLPWARCYGALPPVQPRPPPHRRSRASRRAAP